MTTDVTSGVLQLSLDGRPTVVPSGSTLLDAARTLGIDVPVLCHAQDQPPVGVCRVCVVEVKGARVLAAACVRTAEPGMEVQTASERVLRARRGIYEMLLVEHPAPCLRQQTTEDCELETQAADAGVGAPRLAPAPPRPVDDSSPIIHVEHSACILCDRCIRGCTDTKKNFVIGRIGKGATTRIAFDDDVPMGRSTCVGCGECMVSCPTGALTNKRAVESALPADAPTTPEELLELPMFAGVSGTFLKLNQGSVVKRRFHPGDVICHEGEYGSTAFYLLSGEVEVSIAAPLGRAQSRRDDSRGGVRHFLRRLTSLVSHGGDDGREERHPAFIPIDSSVDVPYETRVARLGAGEIFGEMACLSHYPRSATVRAVAETDVLEMFGNVLYMLQKNKRFKADLDRRYRDRALHTHLKSIESFTDLPEAVVDELCEHAELLRYEPGEVICRQGDPADAFFLVRIGFVKVTQSFPGGDMVLAYLARGNYFGEIGLLQGGVRTATCAALDHVEVVRISGGDFTAALDHSPELRARLAAEAETRLVQNRARQERVSTVPLDDFIAQGLMQAQNLLLLDLESCTRCDLCVRACAEAHDGITRLVRDGLRFDKYLVATSCRSCRDPLCMIGCPVSSIRRRDSLEIVIEDWCIGCGLCAQNCPYGNINLHPFTVETPDDTGRMVAVVREKATTCDLSRQYKEPACVYACPHGAAMRVDPHQFFADRLGLAP